MKYFILASCMAYTAMASVTLDATEEDIRAFSTEDQRKWFDLAFEHRLTLEKTATQQQGVTDGLKKELEQKKAVIDNSVDVLGKMLATNAQVEEWLNGTNDLKEIGPPNHWESGLMVNDAILNYWNKNRKHHIATNFKGEYYFVNVMK